MGQVILANALPLLGMLLVNLTGPITTPSATTIDTAKFHTETAKQEIVWIVKENETLSGIAQEYYGERELYSLLLKDNSEIENPNQIEPGMRLGLRKLPLKTIDLENKSYFIAKASVESTVKAQDTSQTGVSTYTPPTPSSNFDEVYKEAGEKFGIPWQILYGLHLTETGLRDGTIYNGSGSGARGPMQFMPGTFRAYAVDGDGDGIPNIDNARDAIHTAANYLAKHGSLENGLRSYGGNTIGTLNAARERGLNI